MWRRSGSALSQHLALGEEVAEALYGRAKRPVVALESTIISHGMPFPQNLEMARHVEEIVRAHGACPATVCIADGALKVGLAEKDLTQLAELGAGAKKCSTRDIAAAVTDKRVVGATTVSSTMCSSPAALEACTASVKRPWVRETTGCCNSRSKLMGGWGLCTVDISTDLMELSRTPVAVVCAGVKSILDIPRTLEFLETHLGLKEVVEKNIHGQAVTPYLLKRVNEITKGVSLESNIDLVNNNATVGSQKTSSGPSDNGTRVLVVGGLVLDIISSSTSPLIRGTSNIGTIKQSSGGLSSESTKLLQYCWTDVVLHCLGVGRNIAECLHRLRLDPLLVSSVGNDASGSVLLENLKKLGMDTSGVNISDELATAVYSAVLDSMGDMDAAIADMSAFESIKSANISDKTIDNAKLVIADGNLTPGTIGDLFKRSARLGVDTWFEPTSVQKAIRVVEGEGVSSMKYMSPNADELHAISEAIREKLAETGESPEITGARERFPLTKEAGIIPKEEMTRLKNDLITALLAMANGDTKRSKHVMVTLGKHGVLVASINVSVRDLREVVEECDFPVEIWGMHHVHGGHSVTMVHMPGVEIPVTNCTGAGTKAVHAILVVHVEKPNHTRCLIAR
ncbi:unnamed protein product [Phytophthora lilii]|uniref:Unnamed protein product n=1 Tax=Phytophthora lilii TaxID=2077276 RepID=A0A9W6TLT4_9STRA|nr:unnamed protein product [Phytophthora lilii]